MLSISSPESQTASSRDPGQMFDPETDTWTCKVCMLENPPDTTHCVACQSVKGATPESVEKDSFNIPPGKVIRRYSTSFLAHMSMKYSR